MSTPPREPTSGQAASRLRELSSDERESLITAFARCACLATAERRSLLRTLLPLAVRLNAPASSVLLQDVTGLVTTSLNYAGGFQELWRSVRFREGPTYSRGDLDILVVRLFPELQSELD